MDWDTGIANITHHSRFFQHLGLIPFWIVPGITTRTQTTPKLVVCPAAFLQPPICALLSLCRSGKLAVVSDCGLTVHKQQNKLASCKNRAQSLRAMAAREDTQVSSQQRFSSYTFTVEFSSPASTDSASSFLSRCPGSELSSQHPRCSKHLQFWLVGSS